MSGINLLRDPDAKAMASAPQTTRPDVHLETAHLFDDLKGRTARGGAVTFGGQISKFLVQVLATVILARLLEVGDFGLVAMVTAVTGFLALFKDLGLSAATIQREELTHEQVSTLFWINVKISSGIAALGCVCAPLVAWFYGEPALAKYTIVLSIAFLMAGLGVQHQALLRRQMRFVPLAILDAGSLFCGAVVGVTFGLMGMGAWAIVWMHFSAAAVYCLGLWTMCSWRPSRPGTLKSVKSLVKFGADLTGFNVLNYWARHIDKVLLGRLFGRFVLGLYDNAYRLMVLPLTQVNTPMTSVAVPALSRLVGEPARYREAFLRLLQKVVLVTMPGVVFMIVTADWLVDVLLGPKWHEAAKIFVLLGIGVLHQPISSATSWLFITQNRTRDQLHWGVVGSLLVVVAVVAGLPWGAVGVAAAYGFSGPLVRMPLLFWWAGCKGPVKTKDLYDTAAPIFAASVVALVTLLLFRVAVAGVSPWWGLAGALPLTIAATLGALWIQPEGKAVLADARYAFRLLRRS